MNGATILGWALGTLLILLLASFLVGLVHVIFFSEVGDYYMEMQTMGVTAVYRIKQDVRWASDRVTYASTDSEDVKAFFLRLTEE